VNASADFVQLFDQAFVAFAVEDANRQLVHPLTEGLGDQLDVNPGGDGDINHADALLSNQDLVM
jgi:hypothetical protein